MAGALDGLRVLDLTWVLAGPYASMILADLGAEVVKVERPPHGDLARTTGPFVANESIYFQSINRGKRSIALDLRSPAGKDLFLQLVEQADVVMENFTAGTMDRLGLGYDVLRARNPRIIYSATSGFGQTGPLKDRPALDIVIQGMGGVMSITGYPDGPPARPGLSLGDIAAGLYAAIGVLAALQERERSGEGQMLDLSMLDSQIAILENAVARYFATGVEPGRIGTRHPSATPFQAFPTADGWLVLALTWGVANQWELYCAAIGRVDLINDERFDTSYKRTQNHAELEPLLFEAMRQRTTDEWIEMLSPYGMVVGPLNTISQAVSEEQIQHREMVAEVDHPVAGRLRLANSPLRLSRTPGRAGGPGPAYGQDTRAVLGEWLGLDDGAIDGPRRGGCRRDGGRPRHRRLPGKLMRRPALLRRLLGRLRKRLRPDRIEVELDVIEQLILVYLLRFDIALMQDLRDEVLAARRTANEMQVRLSLVRLESLRLIERVPDGQGEGERPGSGGSGGRRYQITRDGKRLRRVIPRDPRSAIQTHV